MKRVKHSIEGVELVHWVHPIMGDESSLCGDSLSGDDDLKITFAQETTAPVNCPKCLEMVRMIGGM